MIVGSGPSLLSLTAADFVRGPVITLNDVIVTVRGLGLPNPLYVMHKDGCIAHDRKWTYIGRRRRIRLPLGCICPGRLVPPVETETVLLSAAESPRCFAGYALRHVFDVEADFGVAWHTPSAPIAVRLAHVMGCASLLMLGHDAYTLGDDRRVYGTAIGEGTPGYRKCGDLANAAAIDLGMAITWR
jgi:hypothetical protein